MTVNPAGPKVRAISQREGLQAQVSAVAAEAGASLVDRPTVAHDTVVLDHRSATALEAQWTDEGRRLVVACLDGELVEATVVARQLGARHVIELPRAALWLADYLSIAADRGRLHAVVGSPGGAGASTIAVALAVAAAQQQDTLLVDADCSAAGLDLLLAAEPLGVTWGDIDRNCTSLDVDSVRGALPVVSGIAVLAGHVGAEEVVTGCLGAVLDAGRRGYGQTVVDVGRGQAMRTAVEHCDGTFLVVRASLPGVQLARRLLDGPLQGCTVTLVVRPTRHLSSDDVGSHLGLPVAFRVPEWSGMAEASDSGELLAGRSLRRLLEWGAAMWGVSE